jgi:sulfite reductase beta subunit-like hemoprotein
MGGGMGAMTGNAMGGASAGMGMNMDQPMTMREILYILSMQDALQVLRDVLSIQERLLESNRPDDKKALLRELKNAQDRLTKLSSDYRGMIAGKNTQ